MVTFTKTANSVEMLIGNDAYYLPADMIVAAKVAQGRIYLTDSPQQVTSNISFLPTEVNGRPSDDILAVSEWLRDTFFTGLSLSGTGGGGGPIEDGVSAAIKATVLDYTNSNPLAVRLTDTNGDYVSSGGGTEYTEDNAAPANPVGATVLARRRDTLSTETTTDGDMTALNSTSRGELYVKHVDALRITDGAGVVNTKQLGTALTTSDIGLVANTTIHGLSTAGGGTIVDVKVTPAGALVTETTLDTKATSSVTSVAASATNVTLLSLNANRAMASFFNDSTSAAYVKLGATASTSSFTIKMAANSFYELPLPVYTGIIDCIWDSATGNMRITEIS